MADQTASPKAQGQGQDGKSSDGSVQISLYHYNDDNRIMVYLDKDGRRAAPGGGRRKKSKGIAGYTSPTRNAVNQVRRLSCTVIGLTPNAQLVARVLPTNMMVSVLTLV